LGVDVSGARLASQRRGGSDGHHEQPAPRKLLIALRNAPHRGIALGGTGSVSRHIDAGTHYRRSDFLPARVGIGDAKILALRNFFLPPPCRRVYCWKTMA